jgi:hypothetical protein
MVLIDRSLRLLYLPAFESPKEDPSIAGTADRDRVSAILNGDAPIEHQGVSAR